MPFSAYANGQQYSLADFDPDVFAASFERMTGDMFEHMFREWVQIGITWSFNTVFYRTDWNFEGQSYTINAGSFVCIYSKSNPTANRIYAQVIAVNNVGTIQYSIVNLSQIGAAPLTATNVTDWVCSPVGVVIPPSGGTLGQTAGGTGATTVAGAQANLNMILPGTFAQIVSDDFCGYGSDSDSTGVYPRSHWFSIMTGFANFNAHADPDVMSRYPDINLACHPGLLQQYLIAETDACCVAMRTQYLDTFPGGFYFTGTGASFEWLFKISGQDKGAYLVNGGWSLRIGLTDNIGDVVSNEIGIGIRSFNDSPTEGNILRFYSYVGGVRKVATGSIYADVIDLYPEAWWKIVITRTGSGTAAAFLYAMDESGYSFMTASLGNIVAGNLPTGGLKPFARIEKRTTAVPGYIEMLSDYVQVYRKLTR